MSPISKLDALLKCSNLARLERNKIVGASLAGKAQECFLNATNLPQVYDFNQAHRRNCENMIGTVSVPVGVIPNVKVNSKSYTVPFATTEGTLVASISRGVKALSDGVNTCVVNNGITRGLLIECADLSSVSAVISRMKHMSEQIRDEFQRNSTHTQLQDIVYIQMGKQLHIRFQATTGDAMGMNMISIGVLNVWNHVILKEFPDVKYISISGNTCTDKKMNSMNWIRGRGYEVNAEAIVRADHLKSVLKITPEELVNINMKKNFIGSALAGTIGGNNSHAANVVAGLYLVTGQDIAQVGTSSMCIFNMERNEDGDLYCSLRMPCVELATVGGGTRLKPQNDYLGMMDLTNASEFASVVASCVIAGELSLLTALVKHDLVSAHMKFNR